jgi:hypothetical protein
MDYNTMQAMQDQDQDPMEEALQKLYLQMLKNKAYIKSIYDNLFDMIVAVFLGTILVLLSNRFVPVNFMGYEGVQPYLSIGIAFATAGYLAYKAFLKKSKMRK